MERRPQRYIGDVPTNILSSRGDRTPRYGIYHTPSLSLPHIPTTHTEVAERDCSLLELPQSQDCRKQDTYCHVRTQPKTCHQ